MARERTAARRRGPGLDSPQETRRRFVPRPSIDPEAFGRLSEAFARFMGTPRFLIYMSGFIVLWVLWNTLAPADLRFDPYAFLFLTLMLSLQASYAAPLILLAQNRQDDRDRVSLEQDRQRAERNLADTEYLAREVAALRIALRDVATRDFLRSELRQLVEELDGGREDGERGRGRSRGRPDGRPERDQGHDQSRDQSRDPGRQDGRRPAPTLEA
ncbi:DUF1003 domain-containing protein [uncultured Pseudokineococcus sp.]|uniref:DUF1003 domain-containing protein n=1 Tax=uncultured Pseudokineococcus sp. TaxID=1642928 RepID=UPI00260A659A|nr:DUF1003 domain-containing protein [uncultured Pseudokineococcus sp.]